MVRRTQGTLGGRSDEVVRRVLEAALHELAQSGYARFRMDEVVARAKVNKTTIYRRWPTRAALVAALVERMRAPLRETRLPDTGKLERDLVGAFTRRLAVGRSLEGRAWARLLDERGTPEVAALIAATVEERGGEWKAMVTRSIQRGEIPRDTDPRLLLHVVRAIADARRTDPRWLVLAVRTAIAGARAGALSAASATSARRTASARRPRRRALPKRHRPRRPARE